MFVLIHGAWHTASTWDHLRASLSALGATSTAIDLPGRAGDTTPLAELTLDAYTDRVIHVLDTIDEPVTLVGHSLGGATISTVAERVPERIDALVYLCALLQPTGSTPADLHASDPDSALMGALHLADDGLSTTIGSDAAPGLFYGDCTDEVAAAAVAALVPEPTAAAMSTITITPERWGSVPRAYVRCDLDHAINPAEQDRMVAQVGVDIVAELAASHSPYLSMPDRLARTLVDLREGLS
ncbi:MAG TPA: alpha/beta fold hydrolase [Microthrixaceae bacterium]|jgi:pimeloyl-ACP methyl ester carboxylesterase|nr:alpha/beta fold hydrolase [Microthrixaceae bacterium]